MGRLVNGPGCSLGFRKGHKAVCSFPSPESFVVIIGFIKTSEKRVKFPTKRRRLLQQKGFYMKVLGFLFDPDNAYGRVCGKIKLVVLGNLMFLICSIPVVTIGASWTALYHVMMKDERSAYSLNPITEFWHAFKSNFKQATLVWVILLLAIVLGVIDIFMCRFLGGMFHYVEVGVWVILALAIVIACFLFPVIAAFANNLPALLKNSLYFVMKNPIITALVALINAVPIALTFLDPVNQPTYVFCFFFFGFGLQAFVNAKLLLTLFTPYLPVSERVKAQASL